MRVRDRLAGWLRPSIETMEEKADTVELLPEVTDAALVAALGHGAGHAGEIVTAQSSMALSAVWACANLVAGTISSLPFEVHRREATGFSAAAGTHPLQAVINDSPNYDQTALDFWDYLNLSIELWGNGYAQVERS
ncbi:hypothetical protein BYZ73_20825, partial [Rhodovulum viride]